MRHIDVDWEREFEQHEIDDYCPFCEGTSIKDHYKLDKDEAKKLEDFRNDYDELEKRDAYCDECESGYIRPMMNYKYPISLYSMELSDARRKACELGLFLYEDEEEQAWIALMGGGMDLSPSILLTYLEIEKSIPLEWATEFQQDYRANISEENHKRIAKACYDTISRNITQLGTSSMRSICSSTTTRR